jgi:hypothetical protein
MSLCDQTVFFLALHKAGALESSSQGLQAVACQIIQTRHFSFEMLL